MLTSCMRDKCAHGGEPEGGGVRGGLPAASAGESGSTFATFQSPLGGEPGEERQGKRAMQSTAWAQQQPQG